MSSAKAALESDTRVLAFEAGRKQKIRVNTISAGYSSITLTTLLSRLFDDKRLQLFWFLGPLGSRAAKAIGFIDTMIEYSYNNAPVQKTLTAGSFSLLQIIVVCFRFVCVFLISYGLWKMETMQMKLGMRQPSWYLHWHLP